MLLPFIISIFHNNDIHAYSNEPYASYHIADYLFHSLFVLATRPALHGYNADTSVSLLLLYTCITLDGSAVKQRSHRSVIGWMTKNL
jgi:hypothetical protein